MSETGGLSTGDLDCVSPREDGVLGGHRGVTDPSFRSNCNNDVRTFETEIYFPVPYITLVIKQE